MHLDVSSGWQNPIDDSGEVFDRPKSHENTRVAVLKRFTDWILEKLFRRTCIIWLYGGTGGGKSTIAQTLAEWCAERGVPLSGFFIFRSDPRRSSYYHTDPRTALFYRTSLSTSLHHEASWLSRIVRPAVRRCRQIPSQFLSRCWRNVSVGRTCMPWVPLWEVSRMYWL